MTNSKNVSYETASRATMDHLNERFGSSTVQTIDYYLKRFDAGLERIYEEPDKVSIALYRLFGTLATVIESEIVNSVYKQFECMSKNQSLQVAVGELRVK